MTEFQIVLWMFSEKVWVNLYPYISIVFIVVITFRHKFPDQNSLQNACSSVLAQNFKLEKLSYNDFLCVSSVL